MWRRRKWEESESAINTVRHRDELRKRVNKIKVLVGRREVTVRIEKKSMWGGWRKRGDGRGKVGKEKKSQTWYCIDYVKGNKIRKCHLNECNLLFNWIVLIYIFKKNCYFIQKSFQKKLLTVISKCF